MQSKLNGFGVIKMWKSLRSIVLIIAVAASFLNVGCDAQQSEQMQQAFDKTKNVDEVIALATHVYKDIGGSSSDFIKFTIKFFIREEPELKA